MLGDLAGRDDVIALALHVDYWDYIGWKDIFADPQYTKRQRSYAQAAGHRSVYTPQFIVQGQDHVIGAKSMKLSDAIQTHKAQAGNVEVELSRAGGKLRVSATSDRRFSAPLVVQLVTYKPKEAVSVKRGENAGRTLNYHNIVTSWQQVDKWNGAKPLSASYPVDAGAPVVVIVQEPGFGQILAAGHLR
ncbi:hypothetical protein ATO10_01850 [Actibacterium atlanticum]|uniref:DUF1223 domain-containing protein n=2 Tax=Actibacterium atlanticum TaxID=1461693 RepID=A0A058ZPE2_9RHOB|nr:hypothetical protein ATO10_01850 [Actibacterium atlanticum]